MSEVGEVGEASEVSEVSESGCVAEPLLCIEAYHSRGGLWGYGANGP